MVSTRSRSVLASANTNESSSVTQQLPTINETSKPTRTSSVKSKNSNNTSKQHSSANPQQQASRRRPSSEQRIGQNKKLEEIAPTETNKLIESPEKTSPARNNGSSAKEIAPTQINKLIQSSKERASTANNGSSAKKIAPTQMNKHIESSTKTATATKKAFESSKERTPTANNGSSANEIAPTQMNKHIKSSTKTATAKKKPFKVTTSTADRLISKLHEKLDYKSDFHWESFGIEAGVCFNSVPSNVAFFNGSILNDIPPPQNCRSEIISISSSNSVTSTSSDSFQPSPSPTKPNRDLFSQDSSSSPLEQSSNLLSQSPSTSPLKPIQLSSPQMATDTIPCKRSVTFEADKIVQSEESTNISVALVLCPKQPVPNTEVDAALVPDCDDLTIESEDNISYLSDEDDDLYNLNHHDQKNQWKTKNDLAETVHAHSGHPDLSEYQDVELPDFDDFKVTVEEGKNSLFEIAQTQLDTFRTNLKNLIEQTKHLHSNNREREYDSQQFHFDQIIELLYGPNSPITIVFLHNLSMTYDDFTKFLATFFYSAVYNLDSEDLNDVHLMKGISKDGQLLNKDEYISVWRKIDSCGSFKAGDRNTNDEPFWMKIEKALNESLYELFLAKNTNKVMIALDDDKTHFANVSGNLLGLQLVNHVRDNRKGFTAHTAVDIIFNFPFNMTWQRHHDTGVISVFKRMVKAMFGKGTDERPNLSKAVFASDRGYWSPILLFSYVMFLGGNILG